MSVRRHRLGSQPCGKRQRVGTVSLGILDLFEASDWDLGTLVVVINNLLGGVDPRLDNGVGGVC